MRFESYIGRTGETRDRVFVTVELGKTERAYQSIEHETVPAGSPELAISGWTLRYRTNSWDSGGQITSALSGMSEFAPGWTEADVDSLRRIWKRWHLNGMTGGCAHMSYTGLGRGYDDRKHLVCPETGYRYGSAWLYRPIPTEVIAEVKRLSALPHGVIVTGD